MTRIFVATALTGGVSGALDFIWPGNDLGAGESPPATGDLVFVLLPGRVYTYRYDETATDPESVPNVIQPDSNTGDGRWLVQVGGVFVHTADAEVQFGCDHSFDSTLTLTATLPDLATVPPGAQVYIEKIGTGPLIIQAQAGQTIGNSSPGGTLYLGTDDTDGNVILRRQSATHAAIVSMFRNWSWT